MSKIRFYWAVMRICEFREGRYNLEILAWARLTLLYSNHISIMSSFSITKFIFFSIELLLETLGLN